MTINPRKLAATIGMLGVAGTAAVVAQADTPTKDDAPDPEVRPYKLPEAPLRTPVPDAEAVESGLTAYWASLTPDGEVNALEEMESPDFDPVGCYKMVEQFLPGQEEHFKIDIPAAGGVSYSQMCDEFQAQYHKAMLLQHMTGKKQRFRMQHGTDVNYLTVEVREQSDHIDVTLVLPAVSADEGGTLIGRRPMAK